MIMHFILHYVNAAVFSVETAKCDA